MGCFKFRNKVDTTKVERRMSFFLEVCKGLTEQEKKRLRELDDAVVPDPGPTKKAEVAPLTVENRD